MSEEKIEILVEGGKAIATPQLAQSLGPKKINIQKVISEINQKTESFKGLKLPVKISIDNNNNYSISIGTPPVSQLIKKEANLEKGSGTPNIEKIGNLAVEQIIKIAKMKKDSSFDNNLKNSVKSIAGSANSMGVLVEGKTSDEFNIDLAQGKYDSEIQQEKTEFPQEKAELLKVQLKEIQEKLKKEQEKLKALEEEEKKAAAPKVAVTEEKAAEEKKEVAKEEVKGKEAGKETAEKAKTAEKVETKKQEAKKPEAKEKK